MISGAATEYRYEKLDRPEVSDATDYFKDGLVDACRNHRRQSPTMPVPWGQMST